MKTKLSSLCALVLFLSTVSPVAAAVNVNAVLDVGVSSTSTVDSSEKPQPTATTQGSSIVNISIDGATARQSTDADVSVSSSAQVQSASDFQVYANAVARSDASVNNIATSENTVTITYKRPAHLFGFIPVNVKEKAEVSVDNNGKQKVSVGSSWWSFLATKNLHSAEFSSALQSKLTAQGSFTANASLSAQTKARILSDIKASSDVTYSGSGSVSY